jgi:hypothetical protein
VPRALDELGCSGGNLNDAFLGAVRVADDEQSDEGAVGRASRLRAPRIGVAGASRLSMVGPTLLEARDGIRHAHQRLF